VGQTQETAEATLIDAGLVVGTVTLTNSESVPAGVVISQAPTAGSLVTPETAVDLVVAAPNPAIPLKHIFLPVLLKSSDLEHAHLSGVEICLFDVDKKK
jgi:beta-lactam-binding protein with PASTA domain